jgi:hypothetical protein
MAVWDHLALVSRTPRRPHETTPSGAKFADAKARQSPGKGLARRLQGMDASASLFYVLLDPGGGVELSFTWIFHAHLSPIFARSELVTLLAKPVPSSQTSNAGVRVLEPVT